MQQTYRHWQLDTDVERILWLTLNRQDASVNSLNTEVFSELALILAVISEDLPVGVIILSGKPKGFIAGADIKQFTTIKSSEEAFDLIRQAQTVLERLAHLPTPTVAMIRGFCLGGGLELALACRYRIASEDPSTQIGLPEVKLGLHPGWGGTVRLPPLIGAPQAMRIMLTGQSVSAQTAARLGIVDKAVPERHLPEAARSYVLKQPPLHRPQGLARWSNAAWLRPWLGAVFEKKLRKKVNPDHYPAPYAIIRNWVRDGASPRAMINEARSIAELMVGDVSRELVRVFFLQDQLKAFAKNSQFRPRHIHVVGAGTMGGDIAAWCAYKGFKVTLQDQSPENIAPAIGRARQLFAKKLEYDLPIQAALDRLQPDPKGIGLARADMVIEAVFEDLAVKRELFKIIESQAKESAILATNTSSILPQDIAVALKNPHRLIGLHFFNPVAKMPLVEVICPEPVDEEKLSQAAGFIRQLGHYPLPVASSPGFLINRILMPYLLEAVILHEEGVPVAAIDQAAKNFGMPMGPIELADRVGLDICLSVANRLGSVYGFNVPAKLEKMVSQKQLGLKTGRGFYHYTPKGEPIIHKTTSFPAPDLTDRLILRLCNEAVGCWVEKVTANADLLDAGMIYGAGFAPFRGGPMEYIRKTGPREMQEKLQQFSIQYGERFKPHPQWSAF